MKTEIDSITLKYPWSFFVTGDQDEHWAWGSLTVIRDGEFQIMSSQWSGNTSVEALHNAEQTARKWEEENPDEETEAVQITITTQTKSSD